MVLLDADKNPCAEIKTIDLLNEKTTAEGERLDILNSLEPDAYGIDMTAIQL